MSLIYNSRYNELANARALGQQQAAQQFGIGSINLGSNLKLGELSVAPVFTSREKPDPNRLMKARDLENGPPQRCTVTREMLRAQLEKIEAALDAELRAEELADANRRARRASRAPVMWWLK